jgi:hypothetical protein
MNVSLINFYAFSADILVAIHFCYVMFVVLGEVAILVGWILKWKWIRNVIFRITHFIAIGGVAVLAISKLPCPLTIWEYQLREKAGQFAEWDISFVGRLLRLIVFQELPDWVFMVIYVGFAGLVLLTVILVPPRFNNRKSS